LKLTIFQINQLKRSIVEFQKSFDLQFFTLGELVVVDDRSQNGSLGEISIDLNYSTFVVKLYTRSVGSYEEVKRVLYHELTHLLLHDVLRYIQLIKRNGASDLQVTEARQLWETLTHKLSPHLGDTQ